MTKILVISPSWIGDAICSQPLLQRLRERRPAAVIDVMAPPWVGPVYSRMPEVRTVLTNPFGHGELELSKRILLGRAVRRDHYDESVVLPNSLKSALVTFFARIPTRTGFVSEMRYGLLNNTHRLNKLALPQQAQRYAQLAEKPGTLPPLPLPEPALMRNAASEQSTIAEFGLHAAPIVFCPGAEYGPAKRWPAEHFANLANMLARPDVPVLLLGSGKDAEVGRAIESASNGCARNLCGETTLIQAMDILAMSSLVVSNDSGLMHVAAAYRRPMVALYGSSSPGYTPPLSPTAQVLSLGLSCSPCFKRECPLGHLDCLNKLSPQSVAEAAAIQITRFHSSPP